MSANGDSPHGARPVPADEATGAREQLAEIHAMMRHGIEEQRRGRTELDAMRREHRTLLDGQGEIRGLVIKVSGDVGGVREDVRRLAGNVELLRSGMRTQKARIDAHEKQIEDIDRDVDRAEETGRNLAAKALERASLLDGAEIEERRKANSDARALRRLRWQLVAKVVGAAVAIATLLAGAYAKGRVDAPAVEIREETRP